MAAILSRPQGVNTGVTWTDEKKSVVKKYHRYILGICSQSTHYVEINM